jgi:hypothetical protein
MFDAPAQDATTQEEEILRRAIKSLRKVNERVFGDMEDDKLNSHLVLAKKRWLKTGAVGWGDQSRCRDDQICLKID